MKDYERIKKTQPYGGNAGMYHIAAVAQKPNIHILATGGTIAGTGASATKTKFILPEQGGYQTLLEAVPEVNKIANVTGEQIVKSALRHE